VSERFAHRGGVVGVTVSSGIAGSRRFVSRGALVVREPRSLRA